MSTFGKYRLIRKLAQGGMAEIYLATAQGLGGFEKKVIIKRILPNYSTNEEFIKMLIHEANTAVRLQHKNIVQIYDLGRFKETYFISMEYIKGKDLRTVLNRLKARKLSFPTELVVFIAREICKGLEYAHNILDEQGERLNLVHRDISPPNILVSLDGEVKIIDFGIAKANSQTSETQGGVLKGKFAYMAPEQARGASLDHRVDIFATGLILWEMMTGKKLLEARDDLQTLERTKNIDSFEPPFHEYAIPDELEKIIRKAIRQDPAERYQSAGDMARDLTIYLNLNYPGFSESLLADFLAGLLDRNRLRPKAGASAGASKEPITYSGLYRHLARAPTDPTDPSMKLAESAGASGSDAAGGELAAKVRAASVVPPPTPGEVNDGERDSDYWHTRDLFEEMDVIEGGDDDEPTRRMDPQADRGWVSVVNPAHRPPLDDTVYPPLPRHHRQGAASQAIGAISPAAQAPLGTPKEGGGVVIPGAWQRGQGPSGSVPRRVAGPLPPPRSSSNRALTVIGILFSILVLVAVVAEDQLRDIVNRIGEVINPPEEIQMIVSYEPKDATVEVDGTIQERIVGSPIKLRLPVGKRHKLRLSREGYVPKEVEIDVRPGETYEDIRIELDKIPPPENGHVILSSLPEGAEVYVNGERKTLEALKSLPREKPLTIEVRKKGYVPFLTTLTLGDEARRIDVVLKPEPVRLDIDGCPEGADVIVNGKKRGRCPFSEEDFVPGTPYRIEVKASGYQPLNEVWTPEVGRSRHIRAALRPSRNTAVAAKTATAAVERSPRESAQTKRPGDSNRVRVKLVVVPWADVYLDGRFLGRTPLGELEIPAGVHNIRLVNRELDIDYVTDKEIVPTEHKEIVVLTYNLG